MDLLRKCMSGGRVGSVALLVLLGWGLTAVGAGPAFAGGASVQWPAQGMIIACPVGVSCPCSAIGSPAPGKFTWHIGGVDYGPYSTDPSGVGHFGYQVTAAATFHVSATYTYTGQGGGSADAAGGTIQAVESRPSVEGGSSAYLAVNEARKEATLNYYPGAGDRHRLGLTVPAGLSVYAGATGGSPLTTLQWDDYSLNNWDQRPSSLWVQATATGSKQMDVAYTEGYWNGGTPPNGFWSSGTHTASLSFKCVQADLQGGVPESQEEAPGAYVGKGCQASLLMFVNGPGLNGEGTVTLTWTNAGKVTVKQGGTILSSGVSWDLPDCPASVTVLGNAASEDFHDVHFEMQYAGHNISSTDRVGETVVEIVWMPLGKPTALTRFKVGRFYVPTVYGGTLTLAGSTSNLYYLGEIQPVDDYSTAIQIVKRERAVTAAGNPCTHLAPYNEFRWFYVGADASVSLTPGLTQAMNLESEQSIHWQPWQCSYYPMSESPAVNLYSPDGPLDKYDGEFSSHSRNVEMWGFGYSFKHRYPGTHLLEADAETTVDYDFNLSGSIESDVRYDFWNAAWEAWVGATIPDVGVVPADNNTEADVDIFWWGHCGCATAALICEKKPQGTYIGANQVFSEEDKKGLLVALYDRLEFPQDPRYPSSPSNVTPGAWHGWLERYILLPKGLYG